jgi:cytosine deaminase
MTFDLIVRGATLPDGREHIDIAARDGHIVAIEPNIRAEAGTNIDARGRLVSPPFVDRHFHMDATLSLGLPRLNQSGTLLEGIALWGELKPLLTHEAVAERALRAIAIWPSAKACSRCARMSTSATTGSSR